MTESDRSAGETPGTLYVVATPIGNLGDITLRAIDVLKQVDLVAAEDTRRTRALLAHLGIRKPIVSYYDAVERARAPELVRRALAGESIALVSDAGTPLISDPGFRLVRAAIEGGINVVPIPGPSAPLALLSCAGLPADRFSFIGFLPARPGERRRVLAELVGRPETLVLFEAGRRLGATLAEMSEILGARDVVIGRELTKRFEEIVRGRADELAARYVSKQHALVKGEVVLAVAGAARGERGAGDTVDTAEPGAARNASAGELELSLRQGLARGEHLASLSRTLSRETGIPRRVIYQRALELRASRSSGPKRGA